jgi:hypothetical protein
VTEYRNSGSAFKKLRENQNKESEYADSNDKFGQRKSAGALPLF